MLSQKRVVLFDWEGTLVDFQWNLERAAEEIRAALVRLGLDPSRWENHYAALRNNALLLAPVQGLSAPQVLDCIDGIYDRYDLDAQSRWSLQPGVKTLLPRLKSERHLRFGLVTNIGRRAIERALVSLQVTGLFDVIITRNDVHFIKPSGEGIRRALERLGADNSDTLYVGDSVSDVLAARDAGVEVAIVQGGESTGAALSAAGPHHFWSSLEELCPGVQEVSI